MIPSISPSSRTNAPKGTSRVISPLDRIVDLVLLGDERPRIGKDLAHSEADPAVVEVEPQDHDLDFLAVLQHVGRMLDTGPADFGDVKQAVDAAQVDEGAIVGQATDDTRADLPDLQRADRVDLLLLALGFGSLAVGEHDLAVVPVHF